MWCGYGMGGAYWPLMGITMILFWGLIIAGVVALVRYLGRTGRPDHPGGAGPAAGRPQAREILDERFARGEIDAEEYRQRLDLLRESR